MMIRRRRQSVVVYISPLGVKEDVGVIVIII